MNHPRQPEVRAPDQRDASKQLRPSSTPYRRWLVLIILAGALLRAFYLTELIDSPYFSHPTADAAFHEYWARGMATGAWETRAGNPTPRLDLLPYLRPPGYSYFLALIYTIAGPGDLAPRIVQMTLGLVNILLAFSLGRVLFGPGVALVFSALMAVCWNLIYFEGELQPPVLLVCGGLLLMRQLCRWADRPKISLALSAGAVLGLLALIRPNVLLFAPVLAIWLSRTARGENQGRRGRLHVVAMMSAVVAVVSLATLRNYLVADEFVIISCNGAINFYIGNNQASDGVTPKIPELKELTGMGRWSWLSYDQIARGVERETGRSMKYTEVSSHFNQKAIRYIKKHPWRTIRLMAKRALLFWGPDEITNNRVIHYDRRASTTLSLLPGFPTALSLGWLGVLAFFGAAWKRKIYDGVSAPEQRNRVALSILALLFVLTYFASFLPFLVAARFRVPLMPFLLMFGAYGIVHVGRSIRGRHWRQAAGWSAAWVVLLALASHSWVDYRPSLTWWHYDRGIAYRAAGKLSQAIAEYTQANQCDPTHAEVHYELARALAGQECLNEAVDAYNEALKLNPEMVAVYNNLGTALARLNKFDQAAVALQKAVRLAPRDPVVHRNLGTVYANLGRLEEAAQEFRRALRLDPSDAEAQAKLDALKR